MSEYKVEKSLSADRLVVSDELLTSEIWATIEEEDRAYNLSLGDAIVVVAPFLKHAVWKVARKRKDIFGTVLLSAISEAYDNEFNVVAGSLLDIAFSELQIQQRERPKLLKWLKNLAMSNSSASTWLEPLSEMEDEEIEWLIPNFIQTGTVHQIQGAMDIGKSMFTADLSAKVSIGGEFFGHQLTQGKVLYLSAEDSPTKVIKQRIRSMGGAVENIYALNGKHIPKFPQDHDKLNDMIVELRPKLIVIDPILAMFEGDMNRETDVRDVVKGFYQVADFYNVAVILVTHTGKSKHANANHNALGSQGQSASVRANFHMALDEDTQQRIITCVKSNNGGKKLSWAFEIEEHEGFQAPRIKHLGETTLLAHNLEQTEPVKDEIKREILDYLEEVTRIESKAMETYFSNNPLVASGMRTYHQARAELKKAGKINCEKVDKKTYWFISTPVAKLQS